MTQSSYALLMIDIQGLQTLNDSYGHEQGNRVLIAVADALKRSTRSVDFVARYGGDEFLIFLSGADKAAGQEVYNRVNQNVYNITLSFERKMQRIKVNVGIAIYPDCGTSIQQVMSFADRAMYREKDFLRNRTQPERDPEEGRVQAGVESWD
jgi:diguanylate cyclase (GGDEF)-like protein